MKRIDFQLYAGIGGFPRGAMIAAAGGLVMVCTAGSAVKASLTDVTGASVSNPVTLASGGAEFYVADSVDSVDLYIMAPGGQFVTHAGFVPGADSDIAVDVTNRTQVAKIPFSVTDQAGDATETDTGFDLPAKALVQATPGLDVTTADAAITIDVGTLSTNSGDANGFLAAASVATAGVVKGTLASGGQTIGALLSADESGAGVLVPESMVSDGNYITYTLLTAADTAAGFILLPYILAA